MHIYTQALAAVANSLGQPESRERGTNNSSRQDARNLRPGLIYALDLSIWDEWCSIHGMASSFNSLYRAGTLATGSGWPKIFHIFEGRCRDDFRPFT